MKPTRHARMLRATVILILVAMSGVVVAGPAQAAAYRFWGYFQLTDGAWAFALKGPAQIVPKDGAVEGWRFAVADESSTRTPRAKPAFDALCAGTTAKAGTKRVGLVLDYGRPADGADGAKGAQPPAARATCVAVPTKATGADVLLAGGAKLRLDKALTCGIDGWPATGCGEAVAKVPAAAASPDTAITIADPKASAATSPAAKPAQTSSNGSRWLILSGVLVLVAVLGLTAWRRGRDASDD
jgi:LPXTG-motif cell wall-anchored protein